MGGIDQSTRLSFTAFSQSHCMHALSMPVGDVAYPVSLLGTSTQPGGMVSVVACVWVAAIVVATVHTAPAAACVVGAAVVAVVFLARSGALEHTPLAAAAPYLHAVQSKRVAPVHPPVQPIAHATHAPLDASKY